MPATLETLRRFIEHAPPAQKSAVPGWQVGDDQSGIETICGGCAGRIIDRGCQLPRPSEPIWDASGKVACCLCDKVF